MIVQKDFLNKLREFGLNTYEARLWSALLSRGISTAGELSDIANVPRSRSYDVLESLEKKGFIIMKLGKPIKYIAVSPEEVLERVKKKIKENSNKQIKLMDELKSGEIIKELNNLHSKGIGLVDPTDLSGSIKSRDNLYNHIETSIKNSKKTIRIVTTSQGLKRKAEILKKALSKAKQKGVKIRIAAPINKDNGAIAKELSKIAELKNSDLKSRFCVIDGREVIFTLMDDENVHPSYDVGVWVNTDYFATALERLFDQEWKKMKSI